MRFLVFFRFKNGGQMVYGRNRFMQWSVKWKKRQIDQPLDHILFFHLTLHCINLFLPYTICPPFLKRKNTRNLISYLCPIGAHKVQAVALLSRAAYYAGLLTMRGDLLCRARYIVKVFCDTILTPTFFKRWVFRSNRIQRMVQYIPHC